MTATTQDGRRGGFGYINRVTNLLHERHGEIYTLQPGTHFTFRHLPMRRRRRFLLF